MSVTIQVKGEIKVLPKATEEQAYTYLVRCADNTYYAGWTLDLEQRLAAHNGERPGGAKYTQGRRPVELVWYQVMTDKQAAQRLEWQIKRLTRSQKEALVCSFGKVSEMSL